MCHSDDRTLCFDWKKVDRSLTQPMKVALCALYFDGDLYIERTRDGFVYQSPSEAKYGIATVRGIQSRTLSEPVPNPRQRMGLYQMTLSQRGRELMNAAKEPLLTGHG